MLSRLRPVAWLTSPNTTGPATPASLALVLKNPKNSAAFVNLVANSIDLFHEGGVQKDDITLVTVRKVR